MLFLLRNIRRKLLSRDNKVISYMLYAVGEIFLVVVGILIAVQIDDWNQHRKDQKKEKELLKSLNAEFQINKNSLLKSIKSYQNLFSSTSYAMELMGKPEERLSKINLDSVISSCIDTYDYTPTQNVLSEILSTGKLDLIQSDSLKFYLFLWTSDMNSIAESWQTIDHFNEGMLIPYLSKKILLKNVDQYSILLWKSPSAFDVKTSEIFSDPIFESYLDNHAWGLLNMINQLQKAEVTINKVMTVTSKAN